MEDAQFDDVGGRRRVLQRVHEDVTEKSVVRSVVAAGGSRSGGARHHGGGRAAYGTRTRRSRGERFAARTAGEVDPREALEKIGPTKGVSARISS